MELTTKITEYSKRRWGINKEGRKAGKWREL
jgi:hypothetical protein